MTTKHKISLPPDCPKYIRDWVDFSVETDLPTDDMFFMAVYRFASVSRSDERQKLVDFIMSLSVDEDGRLNLSRDLLAECIKGRHLM